MALTKLNSSGHTSDIAINGVGYRCLSRAKKGETTFAPRSVSGARDEVQDLEYWWSHRIDDISGGMSQAKVGDASRFWYSIGVEADDDDTIKMGAKLGTASLVDNRKQIGLVFPK